MNTPAGFEVCAMTTTRNILSVARHTDFWLNYSRDSLETSGAHEGDHDDDDDGGVEKSHSGLLQLLLAEKREDGAPRSGALNPLTTTTTTRKGTFR